MIETRDGRHASRSPSGWQSLLVYIHIPFCRSKCHFCDWVQAIPKTDLLLRPNEGRRRHYIDAVCQEIRERGAELTRDGYQPRVVYWGGGTASSLDEGEVEAI